MAYYHWAMQLRPEYLAFELLHISSVDYSCRDIFDQDKWPSVSPSLLQITDDPSANFPRHQLQYLSELGTGWFGQVVAGVASSFGPVAVKILRADASPTDHIHFLQQVSYGAGLIESRTLE